MKELLPKLIGVALLINFSMVLCFVLIDFTNVAANYFITNAQTNANGTRTSLSMVFLDGLQVTRNLTAVFCEQHLIDLENCATLYAGGEPMDIPACEFVAQEKYDQCAAEMGNIAETEQEGESLLNVIISQIGSAAVIFIAAFIIFAGAFMLIIRSIAIWFLVIISPLALICFILPALRKYWQDWLQQFTRWCIFAPAYAFFIWLAAKICTQGTIDRAASLQNTLFADRTAMVNQFFSDIKYIYNFIFIGAFLIGGLIVANKLGIAGAGAAMAMGKKGVGAAKGWAKGKITKYPKEAGYMAGGATAQLLGKGFQYLPGLKSIGRSIESRGKSAWQKTVTTKEMEAFKKRLGGMSPQQRAEEIKMRTHGSAAKLVIAQTMLDKKDDLSKDKKAASSAANIFQAFGMKKEADDMRRLTPHAGKDKKEIEKLTDEGLTRGVHKEYREGVFKEETAGEAGEIVASSVARKQPTVKLALESINQMRRDTRPEFENALLRAIQKDSSFTAGTNNKDRAVYAASTGKVVEAFKDYETGKVNEPAMGEFVKDMKPTDFADVDKASISKIAPYITTNTAKNMTRYLTTAQKQEYFNGIVDENVKAAIKKDWLPETESASDDGTRTELAPQATNTVNLKEGGTPEQRKEAASNILRDEARKLAEREAKGKEATENAMRQSRAMEEKMRTMEEERKKAEKERPK